MQTSIRICIWCLGPSPCLEILWKYIEKVQWRAAHWVFNDYGRLSSVTSMLDHLPWPTLQTHHKVYPHCTKCVIISYDLQSLCTTYYIVTWSVRQYHPLHYIRMYYLIHLLWLYRDQPIMLLFLPIMLCCSAPIILNIMLKNRHCCQTIMLFICTFVWGIHCI